MPVEKRRNDPLFVKIFYRPISFFISAFCANRGIKANTITVISLIPALFTGIFLMINNYVFNIVGALLISLWLLLDCVDGNLARSVQKQPYGEFLDALGSYLVAASIGIGLGVHVYTNGGFLFAPSNYYAIIIGGIASVADLLMRVTHQNYKNATYLLNDKGIISEKTEDTGTESKKSLLFAKIKMEFGIGGIIPPALLLSVIIGKADLILIYLALYNFMSCGFIVCMYIKKALKYINTAL